MTVPRGGVPDVVVDERVLLEAAAAISRGTGPIALDAERASGYRYGQSAYLVQLRREGSGSWLIDPMAVPDLSPIGEAFGDAEWILHAATQDLPCLAEVGLRPKALFDTELGGRLAGRPRVGLGAMVEHYLGLSLAKEHSAADWSVRPLPDPWLLYAALDVEVLGELRDAVAADLQAQGKAAWAAEEFEHLLTFTGPEP
ncbi:MAG: ribonuclease D, partial [Humibacillus sp.]